MIDEFGAQGAMSFRMAQNHIDVFFDGDCPVCKLEVELYQKFGDPDSIYWIDIVDLLEEELPIGKTREMLLNRFHVRDADGEWFVGMDAFARIWKQMPVLKYFAFLFSVPGFRQLAEISYRGFLKWQRWHRKNKRA